MDLYNSTAVHNHARCVWCVLLSCAAATWQILPLWYKSSLSNLTCRQSLICCCVNRQKLFFTVLFLFIFLSHLNICSVALRYNIPDTAVTLCSQRKAAGTESTAAAAWSLKLHLCRSVSAAVSSCLNKWATQSHLDFRMYLMLPAPSSRASAHVMSPFK